MLIHDLAHLEKVTPNSPLKGGTTSLAITANAFAAGRATYAVADTAVSLRTVPSGRVTIGRGRGYALAIGDICDTNVAYAADGFDKIIVRGRHQQNANSSYTTIRVLALDLPR